MSASQGRKDCYKLAMKSSYDEFAAKLEEVKKYIEYESHHHVAPGPSYWLGCPEFLQLPALAVELPAIQHTTGA